MNKEQTLHLLRVFNTLGEHITANDWDSRRNALALLGLEQRKLEVQLKGLRESDAELDGPDVKPDNNSKQHVLVQPSLAKLR